MNDQLKAHENFSLTYKFLINTSQWYQKAQEETSEQIKFRGRVISRIANFLAIPLLCTIDVVSKIASGILSLLIIPVDNSFKCPKFPSITVAGAFATLESGLKQIPSIALMPIIGAIDPHKALQTFHGCQIDRTSELEKQNQQLQDKIIEQEKIILQVSLEKEILLKAFGLKKN